MNRKKIASLCVFPVEKGKQKNRRQTLVISVCLLHDYELLRLFFVFQRIEYQAFQLFCQFGVILDALLCSVASLS